MIYKPNTDISVLPAKSLCVVAIQDETTITALIDGQTVTLASLPTKGAYVIPVPSVNKIKADKPVSVTQGTFSLGSAIVGSGGGGASKAKALRYMGSVATKGALPSSAEVGDMYNVESDGNNYAWTGAEWDSLGPVIVVETVPVMGSPNPISSGYVFNLHDTTWNKIEVLDGKISGVDSRVDKILSEVDRRISQVDNRINGLSSVVDHKFSTIVDRLRDLDGSADYNRINIESAQNSINNLNGRISDLDYESGRNTSEIESLKNWADVVGTTTVSWVDVWGNSMIDARSSILSLSRDMDVIRMEDVPTLQNRVSTIDTRLSTIDAKIASNVDRTDDLNRNIESLRGETTLSFVDLRDNLMDHEQSQSIHVAQEDRDFWDAKMTRSDVGVLAYPDGFTSVVDKLVSFVDNFNRAREEIPTREFWFETTDQVGEIVWPTELIWISGAAPTLEINTAYRIAVRRESADRFVADVAYSYPVPQTTA